MKTLKTLSTLAMLCLYFTLSGQNIYDVQRYSGTLFQSNARSMAVGNAFGALGANPIATSINPAGIAAYPVSEFSFSLGATNSEIGSNYLGNLYDDNKYSLNLPNLSYVFTERNKVKDADFSNSWLSTHFAITMNRRNGFNQSFVFTGDNQLTTMLDQFAEELDYLYFNDLAIDSGSYGGMGYFAYLIDPIYNDEDEIVGFAPSVSDNSTINVAQAQSISSSGSINDLNLSLAGNYGDKLFLGATLGFPVLNYKETGTYTEDNLDQAIDNYNYMTLRHSLTDRGIGIFGQLGMILKPAQIMRIGLSVKTPTFYSVNRTFKTSLEGNTDANGTIKIEPSGYDYQYNFVTPWEVTASAATLLGKMGFLSADYTFFDGSLARLSAEGSEGRLAYVNENNEIKDALQGVHQIRLGGEISLGNFALRLGTSTTTSAYKKGYMPETSMSSYSTTSAGIGYRENLFYMDLGVQRMFRGSFFQPYSLSYTDVAGAKLDESYTSYVLTAGFNF